MELNLKLEEEPFVLALTNDEGLVTYIDAAAEIGGKQKGLRPMQLLAGALAGCMSIDVLSILRKQRIQVAHFSVKVIANRREGIPSSFETIELQFLTDGGVPSDKLAHAVKLSHEKYCSVSASLHPDIQIQISTHQLQ